MRLDNSWVLETLLSFIGLDVEIIFAAGKVARFAVYQPGGSHFFISQLCLRDRMESHSLISGGYIFQVAHFILLIWIYGP